MNNKLIGWIGIISGILMLESAALFRMSRLETSNMSKSVAFFMVVVGLIGTIGAILIVATKRSGKSGSFPFSPIEKRVMKGVFVLIGMSACYSTIVLALAIRSTSSSSSSSRDTSKDTSRDASRDDALHHQAQAQRIFQSKAEKFESKEPPLVGYKFTLADKTLISLGGVCRLYSYQYATGPKETDIVYQFLDDIMNKPHMDANKFRKENAQLIALFIEVWEDAKRKKNAIEEVITDLAALSLKLITTNQQIVHFTDILGAFVVLQPHIQQALFVKNPADLGQMLDALLTPEWTFAYDVVPEGWEQKLGTRLGYDPEKMTASKFIQDLYDDVSDSIWYYERFKLID